MSKLEDDFKRILTERISMAKRSGLSATAVPLPLEIDDDSQEEFVKGISKSVEKMGWKVDKCESLMLYVTKL